MTSLRFFEIPFYKFILFYQLVLTNIVSIYSIHLLNSKKNVELFLCQEPVLLCDGFYLPILVTALSFVIIE